MNENLDLSNFPETKIFKAKEGLEEEVGFGAIGDDLSAGAQDEAINSIPIDIPANATEVTAPAPELVFAEDVSGAPSQLLGRELPASEIVEEVLANDLPPVEKDVDLSNMVVDEVAADKETITSDFVSLQNASVVGDGRALEATESNVSFHNQESALGAKTRQNAAMNVSAQIASDNRNYDSLDPEHEEVALEAAESAPNSLEAKDSLVTNVATSQTIREINITTIEPNEILTAVANIPLPVDFVEDKMRQGISAAD